MRLVGMVGIATGLALGAAGSAGAAVLHEQAPSGQFGSESAVSHDFSNDALDSIGADDFRIGDGQVWTIQGVDVLGGADPAGSHTASIGLCADGAGAPGTGAARQLPRNATSPPP